MPACVIRMRHEKKVWTPWFQWILDGKKHYEMRLADWDCAPGDELVLKEWDQEKQEYTGREMTKTVSRVARTKDLIIEQWWSKEDIEKYGFQIISWEE